MLHSVKLLSVVIVSYKNLYILNKVISQWLNKTQWHHRHLKLYFNNFIFSIINIISYNDNIILIIIITNIAL